MSAAPIHMCQPMPVGEPRRQAVAVEQELQCSADHQPVIAHRRHDEYLVHRQGFGKQPVEPHIGKDAARETQPPYLMALEQPAAPNSRMQCSSSACTEAAAFSRRLAARERVKAFAQRGGDRGSPSRSGRRRRSVKWRCISGSRVGSP